MRVMLLLVMLSSACRHGRPVELGHDVVIHTLAEGVFMHVTLRASDRFPANGLIVLDGDHAILVDSAWNDAQAEELLEYAAHSLGHPITDAIITHGHEDRDGGVEALLKRGVRIHAIESALHNHPNALTSAALFSGETTVAPLRVYFPGPAHAPDNVVVYEPRTRILFGGCMVKELAAKNLGNVADADLTQWPASMKNLQKRFPDVKTVVPGHGEPGDARLLAHTVSLIP